MACAKINSKEPYEVILSLFRLHPSHIREKMDDVRTPDTPLSLLAKHPADSQLRTWLEAIEPGPINPNVVRTHFLAVSSTTAVTNVIASDRCSVQDVDVDGKSGRYCGCLSFVLH